MGISKGGVSVFARILTPMMVNLWFTHHPRFSPRSGDRLDCSIHSRGAGKGYRIYISASVGTFVHTDAQADGLISRRDNPSSFHERLPKASLSLLIFILRCYINFAMERVFRVSTRSARTEVRGHVDTHTYHPEIPPR